MGVGTIISVAVMSSSVVFVNVLEVRWECERGLACVRGAMRATIATYTIISTAYMSATVGTTYSHGSHLYYW